MVRCGGGGGGGRRGGKVNTFNSRLKLLIPAHLCTINKVQGGWWETAGTKFPPSPECSLSSLFALRHWCPPPPGLILISSVPPALIFNLFPFACASSLIWSTQSLGVSFRSVCVWGGVLLGWRGPTRMCFWYKWCFDKKSLVSQQFFY